MATAVPAHGYRLLLFQQFATQPRLRHSLRVRENIAPAMAVPAVEVETLEVIPFGKF